MLFLLSWLLESINPAVPVLSPITFTTSSGNISVYNDWYLEDHKDIYFELSNTVDGLLWQYYDGETKPEDGINWHIKLNSFHKSKLFRDLVNLSPIKNEENVLDQRNYLRLQRRGDDVKMSTICHGDQKGWNIIMMLKTPKLSNGYGEIIFFSQAKDSILATVQPKLHTIIVWPCDVPYQWQYPAIATQVGQIFIQSTIYTAAAPPTTQDINQYTPFPLIGGHYKRNETFDLQDYKKLMYESDNGRPLWVLDNLFNKETLGTLVAHSQYHSRYVYRDIDDGIDGDNVIFVSPYPTYLFSKSKLWSVIEETMEALTGHKGWYPYDVSTNLNRAWDHTRIHPDCFGRDEYTFLLYLNPTYKAGDLGGTVWYTAETGQTIIASVMNKYGRSAIFHCSIPHSARPPHAYIKHARYTFAVKVARSKADAVVRRMSEFPPDEDEELSGGGKYTQTDLEQQAEDEAWDLYNEIGRDDNKLEKILIEKYETIEEEYENYLRYFQEHAGEDLSKVDEERKDDETVKSEL